MNDPKKIPLVDLKLQYQSIKPEIDQAIADVLESTAFINGPRLKQFENKMFYYVATSDNDLQAVKEDAKILNTSITAIDNKNLLYHFDDFEGPTHYTTPAHAIPNALESIFFGF